MATAAQALQQVTDQRNISKLVRRDLEEFIRSHPEPTFDELLEFVARIVRAYGQMSASVALAWYNMLRRLAGVDVLYTPKTVALLKPDEWAKAVGYARAKPEDMPERLVPIVQRLSRQWGRETITENARLDPARVRFARMPIGKTCAFCLMLASRGAVYRTATDAGDMNAYHSGCDCQVVPVFDGEDLPYDAARLSEIYSRARKRAKSGDPSKILQEWRTLDPNASDAAPPAAATGGGGSDDGGSRPPPRVRGMWSGEGDDEFPESNGFKPPVRRSDIETFEAVDAEVALDGDGSYQAALKRFGGIHERAKRQAGHGYHRHGLGIKASEFPPGWSKKDVVDLVNHIIDNPGRIVDDPKRDGFYIFGQYLGQPATLAIRPYGRWMIATVVPSHDVPVD